MRSSEGKKASKLPAFRLPAGFLREASGGVTLAALSVPVCAAAGGLVYGAIGPSYIAQGAAVGLLCGAVGGIIGSALRKSSFLTTIPTASGALIQASSISALVGMLGDPAAASAALPLILLLVGCWQLLFGLTGLTRAIKFTPYPVRAGFVTGIGLLMMVAQLPKLFGASSLATLGAHCAALQLPSLSVPLFGFAVIAIIIATEQFAPRLPNLLVGLAAGVVIHRTSGWLAPTLDLGPTIGAVSLETLWT